MEQTLKNKFPPPSMIPIDVLEDKSLHGDFFIKLGFPAQMCPSGEEERQARLCNISR